MTAPHTPAPVATQGEGCATGAGPDTRSGGANAPDAAAAGPLVITVHGTPAPQGSKRHVGRGIMVESSKAVKPWREAVKYAAFDAICEAESLVTLFGAIGVNAVFYLARPASHYRTGKNAHELRDAAPRIYVAKRPDIDKLLRSTLDALGEAGCWGDDSQVAIVTSQKRYADDRRPGALIYVWTLA